MPSVRDTVLKYPQNKKTINVRNNNVCAVGTLTLNEKSCFQSSVTPFTVRCCYYCTARIVIYCYRCHCITWWIFAFLISRIPRDLFRASAGRERQQPRPGPRRPLSRSQTMAKKDKTLGHLRVSPKAKHNICYVVTIATEDRRPLRPLGCGRISRNEEHHNSRTRPRPSDSRSGTMCTG